MWICATCSPAHAIATYIRNDIVYVKVYLLSAQPQMITLSIYWLSELEKQQLLVFINHQTKQSPI